MVRSHRHQARSTTWVGWTAPPPGMKTCFLNSQLVGMFFGWGENPHFFHLKPIRDHYVYIDIHDTKPNFMHFYITGKKSIQLHCEQDCE